MYSVIPYFSNMPSFILNSIDNLKIGVIMVLIKWESFSEIDPKREYLAFAEMGERKNIISGIGWMMRGRKVTNELKNAKGLIGFTGKVDFWNKKGVMIGVFEDDNSLMEFAHTGQHAQCMARSKSDMKEGMKQAKWSISGSDLPPKIEDAISRIQNKN
jgi:hypothetical protein